MRRLILVKHSSPQIDPAMPSHEWKLSDEGRRRCEALAERLKGFAPAAIVASEEPKAAQTAQLVAERLGLSWSTAPGLHEHDRSNVPIMPTPQFISSIALFFQKPTERVLGRETAEEALDRFSRGVEAVLARHTQGNVVIVTHGTVLALLLEARCNVRPFGLWRQLGQPGFVVVSIPEFELLETVDRV